MPNLILASTSPRRRELLRRAGVENLRVISPEAEEVIRPGASPEEAAAYWSREKALSVAYAAGAGDVLVAADTVVWHGGRIFGKPAGEDEARAMLRQLSGDWHKVYTGVTVLRDGGTRTEVEITRVRMRELTEAQIDAYIRTGEPMDKAGAYGIQDRGALLVERVEGDFYNVAGLPLYRLSRMLEQTGIDLLAPGVPPL
ncbi:MAG: Maf family protein [Oscillospiraceae bacterium]|nr:Maf family protein [Oscillospiraceae bacterium]